MSKNETSGQEASESVDEQRAQWEGTNYRMTVCANGVVNVHNQNYGECDDPLAHIYSVRVESSEATGCSCPHATYRGAHCKHQRAVEQRPLVVSSAGAAGATYNPVATDGGEPVGDETDETETCAGCGREGVEGYVCEQCIAESERKCAGEGDDPTRSEQPDMGGSESTGVVDLE
jgi:hypothetical protein